MKRIRRLLAQVLALSLFLAMVPAVPVHAADCNHNYVISGITAREHSQTCTLCGYTKTESHSMKTTTPEVNKDNADAHGVACSVCGLAYEQGHTYAFKDTFIIWKNYNCTACGYVDHLWQSADSVLLYPPVLDLPADYPVDPDWNSPADPAVEAPLYQV